MKTRGISVIVLILLVGIVSAWSAHIAMAQSGQQTTTIVRTHPSQGDVVEVAGSSATLTTTENGASVEVNTAQLEPGNVYTIWWVVVNRPEMCATSPCTARDFLGNTEAVATEATYGAGQIVDDSGNATFTAELSVGDVPNPWFGNGFTNPLGAEIQIVVNDHGPLIPEMADNMLNTYRGGCTDSSLPGPFPDTAKSDGDPGPNSCRLVQAAVFQQIPTALPTAGGSQIDSSLMWFLLLAAGTIMVAGGWFIQRRAGRSISCPLISHQ